MKYNTPASESAGEVCLALDALHATDYTLHSLHTAHYTAHTTRVEAYRSRSLLLLLLLQRLLLWLPLSLPRWPLHTTHHTLHTGRSLPQPLLPRTTAAVNADAAALTATWPLPPVPSRFFFCVSPSVFFFLCVFFCVCFFLNVFCFKAC